MKKSLPKIFLMLGFLLLLKRDIMVDGDQDNRRSPISLTPQVKLTPHRPPAVIYGHHPIQFQCTGWPDTGGHLYIRFNSGVNPMKENPVIGMYEFFADKAVKVPHELGMKINYLVNVSKDPARPNRDKLTVTLKVCPKDILHGGVIDCGTRDAGGVGWMRLDGTTRLQFKYDLGPTVPRVKVNFHFPPNIVVLDEELSMACSAWVGLHGKLVFAKNQGIAPDYWIVHWDLPEPSLAEGFNSRIVTTKGMTNLGPKIVSSLYITVTTSLHGARFYCFAQDVYTNRSIGQEDAGRVRQSEALDVREITHRPQLRVMSYIDSTPVLMQWHVKGFCRVPRELAQKLSLIVKTGLWTHVTVARADQPHYQHRTRRRNARRLETLNAISFYREGFQQRALWLQLSFFVNLRMSATDLTAICIVKDTKRCQRHRIKMASNPPPPKSKLVIAMNNDALRLAVTIVSLVVLFQISATIVGLLVKKVQQSRQKSNFQRRLTGSYAHFI